MIKQYPTSGQIQVLCRNSRNTRHLEYSVSALSNSHSRVLFSFNTSACAFYYDCTKSSFFRFYAAVLTFGMYFCTVCVFITMCFKCNENSNRMSSCSSSLFTHMSPAMLKSHIIADPPGKI